MRSVIAGVLVGVIMGIAVVLILRPPHGDYESDIAAEDSVQDSAEKTTVPTKKDYGSIIFEQKKDGGDPIAFGFLEVRKMRIEHYDKTGVSLVYQVKQNWGPKDRKRVHLIFSCLDSADRTVKDLPQWFQGKSSRWQEVRSYIPNEEFTGTEKVVYYSKFGLLSK